MTPNNKSMIRISRVLIAALTGVLVNATYADNASTMQNLLKNKQSTIVTVKFILKVKMGGMMAGMGDQESENEINGVMIDPKGLVLCSNTQLGGFTGVLKKMMGPMGSEMSSTPSDYRILIGNDEEGVSAKLVARDSELDLAWVRIKNPSGKTYDYVDFKNGAKVAVGQGVVALKRMGKYFGRTATCAEGHIGGITEKPRDLYIPSSGIMASLGVPVYLTDGRIIGFTIMQMPETEDAEFNPMSMISQMMNMQESMGGFILPAADVAKATARALTSDEEEE